MASECKSNFSDILRQQIDKKNSFVVVGLDPLVEKIPYFIIDEYSNKSIIDSDASGKIISDWSKPIINQIIDKVAIIKRSNSFL